MGDVGYLGLPPFSLLIKVDQQSAQYVSWLKLPKERQSSCIREAFERGGHHECSPCPTQPDVEKIPVAAKDTPRVVLGRASSHVRGSVHGQCCCVPARTGDSAVEGSLRRHRAAIVCNRWRDSCSDRADTTP